MRDGSLSIRLQSVEENCKLNGIIIVADGILEPHHAHAVPHPFAGEYFAYANLGETTAAVNVDGTLSHTHAPMAVLKRWTWSAEGIGVVGNGGETDVLMLPIGRTKITLEVEDTGGDIESDFTYATVRPYGYPELTFVSPDNGDVSGGDTLTINGNFLSNVQQVKIGTTTLSGNAINVLDENKVQITSPIAGQPETVQVSVVTPIGESNSVPFQYIDETLPDVSWQEGIVDTIEGPTSVAFGPDGNLYIGGQFGEVTRWTLDDNYNVVGSITSLAVANSEPGMRFILGIAFDPNDTE